MSTLEVVDLVKKHGDVAVVNGINLTVRQGEILTLLGPSGCGKTTVLKCVAGLEDLTSGTIRIGGVTVAGTGSNIPPEKRDIGLVFQSYALWPHKTVIENVSFGLKLRRTPRDEIGHRVDTVLRMMEIEALGSRYPGQLSGGQQQRVALARSIVSEPKILLFDEPLSNLDAQIRERVRSELYDLLRTVGITTLYVTHDRAEAMAMSDRIVVMQSGRIQQIGSSRQLYEEPVSRFVAGFIGDCNFVPVVPAEPDAVGSCFEPRDGGVRYRPAADGETPTATIAFRPHDADLVDAEVATNCISGRVVRQTYFGGDVEIAVDLGSTIARVRQQREVAHDKVSIQIQASRIHLFEAEPEENQKKARA